MRLPGFVALTSHLCASEAHVKTEDLLLLGGNLPGLQIHVDWHTNASDIHGRMETAFGEHVYQHRQGNRVLKQDVFRVDIGDARNRVTNDDRHHLCLNKFDHPAECFWLLHLIAVQAANEVLPGVPDDIAGQWQPPKPIEGARV